ncbi:MAG TPA: hypothetical protein VFU14_09945 [Acidimicrobiales bacterium]|nr:hypothetical protein [Acidimicrobiales bacterium]
MSALPDLEDLGLAPVAEDVLARTHALRVARTLDLDDAVLAAGTLPLTWIWTFFTPTVATDGLRDDGHPAGRGSGPLAGLERRMFVGGSLVRSGPLRLDEPTQRTSTVVDAEHKEGGTGPFLLVQVEHAYRQDGDVVLVERQRLMYRTPPADPVPPPGPPVEAPPSAGARLEVRPDERLLFRYSALTFNTHRIHYDLPYVTEVEGYPGLVVHGPLTATLLAHLAEQQLLSPLSRFEFRATSPTFAGTGVSLVCDEAAPDGTLPVRAVREDGATVMTAQAR